MRALVHDRYGTPTEVLRWGDRPDPVPGAGEAFVRVQAAGVNPADWRSVSGEPLIARLSLGLRAPRHRVPGCDIAGEVIALGPPRDHADDEAGSSDAVVPPVRVGDPVVGCAFGAGLGGFAEQVVLPVDRLVRRPDPLDASTASVAPLPALTALQTILDHARVGDGSRVLVIGASGAVGGFAVQFAAAVGARVDVVCRSTQAERVRGLGAERVFAFDDAAQRPPADTYDAVVQAGGADSVAQLRSLLRRGGALVQVSGDASGRVFGATTRILSGAARAASRRERNRAVTVRPNASDLARIVGQVADGTLRVPPFRTIAARDLPPHLDAMRAGIADRRASVDFAILP